MPHTGPEKVKPDRFPLGRQVSLILQGTALPPILLAADAMVSWAAIRRKLCLEYSQKDKTFDRAVECLILFAGNAPPLFFCCGNRFSPPAYLK